MNILYMGLTFCAMLEPWLSVQKVFIVVASAVLRHCSEHKTLQDPNMSAADKALTSKAEMVSMKRFRPSAEIRCIVGRTVA